MGTYVNAEIVYGIVISEPEIDWDAPYDENTEEPEPIDYWEMLRVPEFSRLDFTYAGDSQWDDESKPYVIHVVAAGGLSVGEESVRAIEPEAVTTPDRVALDQLAAVRGRLPGKKITEPAWLLLWNRG